MGAFIDLTGQRFGRLTVLNVSAEHACGGSYRWHCACDCGVKITTDGRSLRSGNTKSCGCLQREIVVSMNKNGVMKQHNRPNNCLPYRLYAVWKSINQRCNNPRCKDYPDYGGRGIVVCNDWKHSYTTFREWAFNNGYDEKAKVGQCTIDRIDCNGNYTPENCRWVSMKVQNKNKRKDG